MKKFAVIGKPVSHSKSPLMFNSFFEKKGINAYYSRIASQNFSDAVETCKLLGISGINATMPYKKELLEFVDTADSYAKKINGVNTAVFGEKIKGYNTDIFGATIPLQKRFAKLQEKKVLIIGAGAAAKAALLGLKEKKAECFVSNRSRDKGIALAESFNSRFVPFEELNSILAEIDALIYTIPVKIPLNVSLMKNGSVFFSAIYKSRFFEKECVKNGIKVINGEEWLVEQGRKSCEFFGFGNCGKDFGEFQKSKNMERMAFTGFMGSGKTSIGRLFAEKIGYRFIDLDEEIERGEGISIPEIFEKYGEDYFRQLEANYLEKFSNFSKTVIASGGGIVSREKTFNVLKDNFFNIFLCGAISEFYSRTKNSSRPLRKDFDFFKSLYLKRLDAYFSLSDLALNSSNKSIENCVNLLFYELSKN